MSKFKGKKLPLGDQGKKSSFRALKKGFFLISFGPPKEVFSLWYLRFGQGVEDRGNFFQHVKKITQILEFSKYQGGKI